MADEVRQATNGNPGDTKMPRTVPVEGDDTKMPRTVPVEGDDTKMPRTVSVEE